MFLTTVRLRIRSITTLPEPNIWYAAPPRFPSKATRGKCVRDKGNAIILFPISHSVIVAPVIQLKGKEWIEPLLTADKTRGMGESVLSGSCWENRKNTIPWAWWLECMDLILCRRPSIFLSVYALCYGTDRRGLRETEREMEVNLEGSCLSHGFSDLQ